MMKRPAADISAEARQCLRADGGLETVREDAPVRLHPHDLSGSKLEAEKVKADVGKVAAPVDILAVDDLRLLRMQHQLAGRQAVGNRAPECPRLLGALAMTNDIVRVPLEQDVCKVPRRNVSMMKFQTLSDTAIVRRSPDQKGVSHRRLTDGTRPGL